MEPNEITTNLSEIDEKKRPVTGAFTYVLKDPETLFEQLLHALDTGEEETFSTEAEVVSKDASGNLSPDTEIFKVSFTTKAKWGLMGKVEHPDQGAFRFYLEFLRDA